MEQSILMNLGVDPAYLMIGMAVLILILIIVVIVCILQIRKLYRRYDFFMRGKDAESLEDIIMENTETIKILRAEERATKDTLRSTNKNMRASFQKFGMVKYNAFKGMGGNLSFVFAMLDYTNTGFILNSVHSRDGCYLYIKTVDCGKTEILLGSEEKEALEQALGY